MEYTLKVIDVELNVIATYLSQEGVATRLTIPTSLVDSVLVTRASWQIAYAEQKDSTSRSKTSTAVFNQVKEDAINAIKGVKFYIKGVESVLTLTPTDREKLFVPKRKTRSVIKKPSEVPAIEIISRTLGAIKIQVSFFEQENLAIKRFPDGVSSVVILTAITQVNDAAPQADDFKLFMNSSRSRIELIFDEADRKKEVYMKIAYENEKGERGPFSEVVSIVIPN